MMHHRMKLMSYAFNSMKSGQKTVELRCNDEKRQKVSKGDLITFHKLPEKKESLTVIVKEILSFQKFFDLLDYFHRDELGFKGSLEDALKNIYQIYSPEEEKKHGVVGIRVQVVE